MPKPRMSRWQYGTLMALLVECRESKVVDQSALGCLYYIEQQVKLAFLHDYPGVEKP